ncbi:hypothetical protein [Streptomyces sp. NPDC051180]|uniref:hypothetical protein n=1 Tax=unclassified Streptomyces TaxID=2593676 RepID=UPI00345064FB
MPPTAGAGERPEPALPSAAHDPIWWAAPLTGSLGGPLLVLLTGATVGLPAAPPAVIAASLLPPLLTAAPTWFLPRTLRWRRARRLLAGLACAVGLAFPVCVGVLGVESLATVPPTAGTVGP